MGHLMLLVRHGQSTWNAEHRWAGQADPPLTAAGRVGVARLAEHLVGRGLAGVATSDLCRASETAAIVSEGLGIGSIRIDERLRERRCEPWSGLTSVEIEAGYPGMLASWRRGDLRELPEPSEPWEAFAHRVLSGLVALASSHERWLVVSHAGVFRVVESACEVERHHVTNLDGLWLTFASGRLIRAERFTP